MNAVLEYALMLAAKGIPVFPCKPDKRPYTQHGFKDASTDPEQIKAWWAQYPKAMIGMPTGKASGVWVLDIDAAKEGETVDGYASLEDLTAKYGQLPATRKHTTGGGGTHYLFCYPKDGRRIGNSAKRMPPKIDVRGEGGYIIVPPSVNASGGVYTVKDKTSIADTPDWLLDLVSPLPERDKSKNATPEGPYFEKYRKHYREAHIKRIANLSVYAKTAIMREIEALASSIPDMNRNANLNSTAFALGRWVAGGELPEDDALTMLCDVANLIELDVDETAKTLESGLSAGMKEPRNTQRPSGETSTDSTAFAYKVYSCAEILNIPRPQWRVKNVLPGIGLAAIFGPSRAGKSFLALDLAFAITRGADWFQWETVPCPVLYVNLESSWGLQGRLKAWAQDTGHTLPEDLHFIIEPLDLQEGEHVQGIIQAAPGNGVVIIDTLNRATPGADENSSRDMSNIIKAATEIQAATGSLVLFVAHSGKNAKLGIRGHTSFIAALDAAIEVDRKGDARVLKLDKVKEGQDGVVQDFQLKKVVIESAPDSNEVTSCVVEPVIRLGKEKFLTPALKYAIDSLDKACEAEGKMAVHLKVWRPVFYKGHTGETTDAKQRAFLRARKDLVELGVISVHDDFYSRTTGLVPDNQDMS